MLGAVVRTGGVYPRRTQSTDVSCDTQLICIISHRNQCRTFVRRPFFFRCFFCFGITQTDRVLHYFLLKNLGTFSVFSIKDKWVGSITGEVSGLAGHSGGGGGTHVGLHPRKKPSADG